MGELRMDDLSKAIKDALLKKCNLLLNNKGA